LELAEQLAQMVIIQYFPQSLQPLVAKAERLVLLLVAAVDLAVAHIMTADQAVAMAELELQIKVMQEQQLQATLHHFTAVAVAEH
jgi:hypothetical protein